MTFDPQIDSACETQDGLPRYADADPRCSECSGSGAVIIFDSYFGPDGLDTPCECTFHAAEFVLA